MRRVILGLVMTSIFALASDTSRVDTMRNLETAFGSIQKGFLYNNEGMVEKGVNDFKKNLTNFDAFVSGMSKVKDFDPTKYAHTEIKSIGNIADDILASYKSGKKHEAVKSYNDALTRCLACHRLIRKW